LESESVTFAAKVFRGSGGVTEED